MTYLRLILSILLSLFLLTFLVETIEFSILVFISNESYLHLSQDQQAYFALRNQPVILIAKPIYTFIVAFTVSYLGSRLLRIHRNTYFIILSVIQGLGICYGAFLSEYKDSLPLWYWMLLLLVILIALKASQSRVKHL